MTMATPSKEAIFLQHQKGKITQNILDPNKKEALSWDKKSPSHMHTHKKRNNTTK